MRPDDQTNGKLVLIDFGLVAKVEQEDMDAMVSSIVHLANKVRTRDRLTTAAHHHTHSSACPAGRAVATPLRHCHRPPLPPLRHCHRPPLPPPLEANDEAMNRDIRWWLVWRHTGHQSPHEDLFRWESLRRRTTHCLAIALSLPHPPPITNHLIPSLRQSVRPPTAVDALVSPPHGSSRLVPSVTSGLRRPCR